MDKEPTSFMRNLRCPACGSFLDAPRTNPLTGRIARKCLSCLVWHEREPLPKAGLGPRPRLPSRRRALAVSTLAVLALAGCGSDNKSSSTSSQPAASSTPTTARAAGKATTLDLKADPGGMLRFDKKTLTAPAGTVTIAMTNPSQVDHDIAIEGNGVDKSGPVVKSGGTSKVTADLKPGKYEFYCTVDGHKQAGMTGTLTVR
jgi:plastocyanin